MNLEEFRNIGDPVPFTTSLCKENDLLLTCLSALKTVQIITINYEGV